MAASLGFLLLQVTGQGEGGAAATWVRPRFSGLGTAWRQEERRSQGRCLLSEERGPSRLAVPVNPRLGCCRIDLPWLHP